MRSGLIGKTAGTPNAGDPRSGGTVKIALDKGNHIPLPVGRAKINGASASRISCVWRSGSLANETASHSSIAAA